MVVVVNLGLVVGNHALIYSLFWMFSNKRVIESKSKELLFLFFCEILLIIQGR